MIIDPDMPDHWKTRMLVGLLGDDELAPVYLMRLWGHCQNRKKAEFDNLPPLALKAICRYQGDADFFTQALQECGFISCRDGVVTVVGWEEHNASLVANWENGKKGGRPRKQGGSGNPAGGNGKGKENPRETHGVTEKEPPENPDETDREDREDSNTPPNPPRGESPPATKPKVSKTDLINEFGVDPGVAAEYLEIRKAKRAPLTRSAMDRLVTEFGKAGLTVPDGIRLCAANSWQGFKAHWEWRESAPAGLAATASARPREFPS